jgi:hypothetical protein
MSRSTRKRGRERQKSPLSAAQSGYLAPPTDSCLPPLLPTNTQTCRPGPSCPPELHKLGEQAFHLGLCQSHVDDSNADRQRHDGGAVQHACSGTGQHMAVQMSGGVHRLQLSPVLAWPGCGTGCPVLGLRSLLDSAPLTLQVDLHLGILLCASHCQAANGAGVARQVCHPVSVICRQWGREWQAAGGGRAGHADCTAQ